MWPSGDEGRLRSQRSGVQIQVSTKFKNRSAMRTWGLMLSFILFGWNDVLKYQHLGVELLQVRR